MEYLLKASAVTIIFYVFYKIFLQRDTFFESNRWFLLIGLITSGFIPLVVIPIYMEQTPVSLDYFVFTEDPVTTNNNSPFNLLSLLKTIYFLGMIIFALRFTLQLRSLIPLLIKSEAHQLGHLKLLKTDENISPFSFFNYIVYNPNPFNETELNQIITHEKVHVQQYHTIDVMLAQIACVVFWFNPFIWLYNKDLKQNLEFIADKTAINYTHCKKSYQYTLLKTSLPNHQLALTNNFYNSLIKKRIVMLHKSKSKKINLLKYALIIPALALFLMSFNTKEVIIEKEINPVKTEFQIAKKLKTNSIEVVITKDYSDSDFEKLKTKFKNEGLTLKIKGIKRNQQGEITAIKIDVSSKSSNANYSIDADEAINPIKISVDEDGKNISIGNAHLKKEHNMVFISEDGQKHEINNSDSDDHVFVISTDDGSEEHIKIKKFIVKTGDSLHVKKIHKRMDGDEKVILITKDGDDKKNHKLIKIKTDGNDDDLTWTMEEEDEEIVMIAKDDDAVKKHKVVKIKTDGKDPLYMVDGKEITREEMNNISPETIDKVEVLKGDSATEKYGDKGKNGVILITTKNKN
ncbi:M56 family metallopeptidase [Gaetbulibacter aquiaggeris]|uniref:M56 family metallopeptidase n=1 Tax=Gaetbulibacter aquiaggeris TaxID=1735373 RepID=A0ABW7MSR2_9FLAO